MDKVGGKHLKMPTASQSLLSRRSGESPLTTPRIPGTDQNMSTNPTSAVKSLTVTFPKVYLDQRHGHSTLRGVYRGLSLDTKDVDKIVKKYIRTGNSELQLPMSRHPWQAEAYYQSTEYKALPATEMLPVRRIESLYDKEDPNVTRVRIVKRVAEDERDYDDDPFDDDFCRSRPLKAFLDGLSDEELQEHQDDYIYLEVASEEDTATNPNRPQEKDMQGRSGKILKLRKVDIPLDEGDTDVVFVDDSDLSKIKVYRMEDDNKLVHVKDIEVDNEETLQLLTDRSKSGDPMVDTPTQGLSKNCPVTKSTADDAGEESFSLADYLKENIHSKSSNDSHGKEKHKRKHGHNRKTKHHAAPGKSSERMLNTGHASELQFPQKSVLPSVSTERKFDKKMALKTKRANNIVGSSDINQDMSNPWYRKPGHHEGDHLSLEEGEEASFGEDFIATEGAPDSDDLALDDQDNADPTGGLTRMQQLSVEKKLKFLEPPQYFYDPPVPRPLTMCFDHPGTNVTHGQVKLAVKKTLENIPDAKVTSLQFVARNVILGTIWVDNRWIMDLSTKQCVTVLLGRGIMLNGEQIKLRKYDDIIKEDYDKFLMNKERFLKKGNKKQAKATAIQQPNALTLLDKTMQGNGTETQIESITADMVQVSA